MQEKWIVFFQKRRAPTRPIYIMGFYKSTKHNLYLHKGCPISKKVLPDWADYIHTAGDESLLTSA